MLFKEIIAVCYVNEAEFANALRGGVKAVGTYSDHYFERYFFFSLISCALLCRFIVRYGLKLCSKFSQIFRAAVFHSGIFCDCQYA
jgi:hypothetical protein